MDSHLHKMYLDTLQRAIDIKLDRQKLYGDGWVEASTNVLIDNALYKIHRAKNNKDIDKVLDDILEVLEELENKGKIKESVPE